MILSIPLDYSTRTFSSISDSELPLKNDKHTLNVITTTFRSQEKKESNRDCLDDSCSNKLELLHYPHFSAEEKKSPVSKNTINKVLQVPNFHLENGYDFSTEKDDTLQIHDITGHDSQSTSKEPAKACIEQNDSVAQPETNSQPTFSELGRKENLPPFPTSPGYSVYQMPSRSLLGANDISHDSSGLFHPCSQVVFPPRHFATFENHDSPGKVSDYFRLCSYPPGIMLQPPYNSMPARPYQQVQHAVKNKGRRKRPFDEINIPAIMKDLGISESAADLDLAPFSSSAHCNSSNIAGTGCNASTDLAIMNPPLQTLIQDSPCTVNGSSGNLNESLTRDTNDEPDRKKIRRIPEEEKDEKYLEKRRKNNSAAKKSKGAGKKKDDLAICYKELLELKVTLETRYKMLYENFTFKEQRLDMVIGNLISFREKCEGRA
ncbi:hypothetical protein AVEN_222678-1 [Araneus ventricosus]|uniref:BZIP domain-containing protein n=1 Tax=Araneus ventricosus TaxID=182803 RepID=A0A4Y2AZE9_ARAVE|nr:hypothetical protein AVEN_222678-1 [Araneus ventricosus]